MSKGVGFGRPVVLSGAVGGGSGRRDAAVGRRLRMEVGSLGGFAWDGTWLSFPEIVVSTSVEIRSCVMCRFVCLTTVVCYGFGTFPGEDSATIAGLPSSVSDYATPFS
ncbi:hypothetical protein QQ045_031133 [Rhodiola kirilowii]